MSEAEETLAALERMAAGCYVCKGDVSRDYVKIKTGVGLVGHACKKCFDSGWVVECDLCCWDFHDEDLPWTHPAWEYDDKFVCRWCYDKMQSEKDEKRNKGKNKS